MCSENQRQLYTQFEPDANELVFGQRTAPDRPLTDKEISQRRKIILKLVDQKLKLELIELMKEQSKRSGEGNETESNSFPPSANGNTFMDARTTSSNYFDQQCYNRHLEFENISWQQNEYPQQCLKQPQHCQFFGDSEMPRIHMSKNQQIAVQTKSVDSERQLNSKCKQAIPKMTHDAKSLTNSGANKSLENIQCNPTIVLSNAINIGRSITPSKVSTFRFNPFKVSPLTSCNNKTMRSETWPDSRFGQRITPNDSVASKEFTCSPQKRTFPSNSEIESTSTPVTVLNAGASPCETVKRKQEHFPNENIKKKMLVAKDKTTKNSIIEKPTDAYSETDETHGADVDWLKVAESEINLTMLDAGRTETSKSIEWKAMNALVWNLFQNRSNNWAPLKQTELQLKNKILAQVSVEPNSIRDNKRMRDLFGTKSLGDFINNCKAILASLSQTSFENQVCFIEEQKKLVAELKAIPVENHTFRSAHSKIASLLSPFLCAEQNNQTLIAELVKNPHTLQSHQSIKNQISAKGLSIRDVMKSIKDAVDEFKPARLPKKFYMPADRRFDVPFMVNLYDRRVKMTQEIATVLTKVLFDSIACLKTYPKPALRDVKFKDGSLTLVCLNSMSFEWLTKNISNHLAVNICPVKNVILSNQLKTIRLEFERPQYLHFNCLMEGLRLDNRGLLTRRWERRTPPNHSNIVDSTKFVYVGVDIESLIICEKLNRVGRLGDSLVFFKISYSDNEENFNFK